MSSERIRELLAELDRELQQTEKLDAATREQLAHLNDELDDIADAHKASALERVEALETRFAADHPVAERLLREVADLIAKMGI